MSNALWIRLRRFWWRAGWKLGLVVVVAAVLGAMAMSSQGGPTIRVPVPSADASGMPAVPVPTPTGSHTGLLRATPGCAASAASTAGRRAALRRGAAAGLPADGRPTVGGVRLPRGSRCPTFWSTDGPVADAVTLAQRLSAVHRETGLWPILWAWAETPENYFTGEDVDRQAPPSAEKLLRAAWESFGEGPLGPLASTQPSRHGGANPFGDPFRAALYPMCAQEGCVVMLVRAKRPADAYAALGTQLTEHFTAPEVSRILASWEDRFAAVLTVLTPSTITWSVSSPPLDGTQAGRLAREMAAFAPEDDLAAELPAMSRALRNRYTAAPYETSSFSWTLGWPD